MNPILKNASEENGKYRFTLSGINVSIANAIRRTILADIPAIGIDDEQSNFIENTGRLHNEILKQRLACIPVFVKNKDEIETFIEKYMVEVDVTNETDNIMFVTTKDFRIKNKATGSYMNEQDRNQIFPANPETQMYIDFSRLRAMVGDSVKPEHLSFTAEFTVKTAKQNGGYSVVSSCAYGNTIDHVRAKDIWNVKEKEMRDQELAEEEIQMAKKNFHILDAQRFYVEDSFDFIIETIGVYTNYEIMRKACLILQNQFVDFVESIENDDVVIGPSESAKEFSTMENSFNIILEKKDYTFGKVLEYICYNEFFENQKILTFSGFKKFHPHDENSVLRLAFIQKMEINDIRNKLKEACVLASEIFVSIHGKIPEK